MPKTPVHYEKVRCEHCGQTTTWASRLNPGMADIVRAIASAVAIKGINAIHPTKEMLVDSKLAEWRSREARLRAGKLTPNQTKNMGHARVHGLVAMCRDARGSYLLTPKGADFLKGALVPLVAIVDKTTGHNVGYASDDEGKIVQTSLREVCGSNDGYWVGWDYDVVEGSVVQSRQSL